MKVHLQVTGAPRQVATDARELAETGADGLFTFEGPHDVFFPLVVAAGATSLELMTNVAIAGPRSPMHLAHAAYDLQVYSEGRFRLGLGSQIRAHIEKRYGSTWGAPAERTAESVAAVREILAAWEGRAPLNFRGKYFTHTLMPPTFDPGPNPFGPPPVLMGALGPVMTRKAAEVADGLLVMPFNSARHFTERTLPALTEGLRRSGRTADDFPVIAQVMVALGRTEEALAAAIDGVSALIAFYGSTPAYRPVLEVEGWAQVHSRLNALSKAGGFAEMRALVTDEMVRRIGVAGTPEECAAQITTRFGAGIEEVCCYFPGYTPDAADVAELVDALRERRDATAPVGVRSGEARPRS
ncbi:TIGR03617 family F420-dependent LLM class oxidoreductase [Nocardia sputorum]|uniref:LLM class F420-dependent oxidoreductase n=1 Tax=Nocardia sputorum TaxID=2984338 RepID=A0ABN6U1R8_9NOCA|nr:TIGR03617 family F420-dependent LLM class oxidoreductase [Nocardia sputorum]BDT99190.1 LLM class F420-dependent oxidoreductase [Nocardia sputorum]